MKISDLLWCWANDYCTKHVVELVCGECEKCTAERVAKIKMSINDDAFTGTSIHTF